MTDKKLVMMFYRLPPQQQTNFLRIFAPIAYYMIDRPKRGLMFLLALYPVTVAAQSVADTLYHDLGWNPLVSAFIGIMIYECWNYWIVSDANRLARKTI